MNLVPANSVLAWLGTLGLTSVGAATTAFVLFKFLGGKWLEGKFNERLEAFKHVQQQEIERLRLLINTAFDRTVKLHAYEYEILPEVWEKLNDAFGQVMGLVSPYQEYPDLDKMPDPAFLHFLSECGLPGYQQQELANSSTKTKSYQSMRFWQSLGQVSDTCKAFRRHYRSKGIFIQPVIKSLIDRLDDMMFEAMLEKEHEERDPEPRKGRWEKCTTLRDQGPKLRAEIEQAIQARLWDTTPVA